VIYYGVEALRLPKQEGRKRSSGLDPRLAEIRSGRLNQKLDMLERYGIDGLPPKLVAGPLGGHRHIYKLRIDGSVAMRPMLCKGPIDMNREFTLLLGATERDRVLDPMDAPRRAEQRRTEIIANPTRRCNHERVAK